MGLETVISEEHEKQGLVLRIARSASFRNAPRLCDFLLFVTERALSGKPNEISEQALGQAVFHRPEHYDTTNDNIVRVSARQVRIKLKEYADCEGRDDVWLLEMPKGGYVPIFTRRFEPALDQPSIVAAPVLNLAESPADHTRYWQFSTLVLALVALGFGLAFFRTYFSVTAVVHKPSLTDIIIRPGQRTLIVLADSSLVLLHELTGQTVNVHDYEARQYPQAMASPDLRKFAKRLSSIQLTSLANLGLAMGLARTRPDAADRIQVIHARNVTPRNLKENNLILVGGSRSNPWAGLFEDRLNFRFDFSNGRQRAHIVNTKPQPGEAEEYISKEGSSRGFGRLALTSNLNHSGKVLLISGTTIEATEAASEFFLDDSASQTLSLLLGRKPSEGLG